MPQYNIKQWLLVVCIICISYLFLMAQDSIDLPDVKEKPSATQPQPQILPTVELPGVKQGVSTGQPQPHILPTLSFPDVLSKPGVVVPEKQFIGLELPRTEPDVFEPIHEDFTGGLNHIDFPNRIPDKDAVEQENFIWSMAGKLVPRPGFAQYNTAEFDTGEHIWGLYSYYTKDGSKIVLAGVNGALWADTNDNQTLESVYTGLESNNKFYDFETFKGRAIVAHEDDHPFWFCMSCTPTTGLLGMADEGDGLFRSGSSADCESWMYVAGEDWEDDYWIGYFLRFEPDAGAGFYDDTARCFWIIDNTADSIWVDGWFATDWSTGAHAAGEFQILSYFQNEDPVVWGTIQSSDTIGCIEQIVVANQNTDPATYGIVESTYVFKLIHEKSRDQVRTIVDYWAGVGQGFHVSPPFDSIAVGDSFYVYKVGFYKPQRVETYKNRLFLADAEDNAVYFSVYNSYGDFPPENYFFVNTEDGDLITSLNSFYDDQLGYKDASTDFLAIFKQNSLFKMVWNSSTDYALVHVASDIGCVAPETIVGIENKYFVFLHTTGVYGYDGRTVQLLSQKIDPTIKDIARNPNHNLCTAGYTDRHYYMTCPLTVGSGGGAGVGQTRAGVAWYVIYDPWDVYMQRLDYDGAKIGCNIRVHDDEVVYPEPDVYAQQCPDIAMCPDGRSVVVWADDRYCVDEWRIWAQRFTIDGVAIDTNFRVDSDAGCDPTYHDKRMPHIAMHTDGRFVVTWQDNRRSDLGILRTDIRAQIFDSSGSTIGSEIVVDTGTVGQQFFYEPHVVILPNKNFVVGYLDTQGSEGIFIQKFDSLGAKIGGRIRVDDDSTETVHIGVYVDMGVNSEGKFIVVWDSDTTDQIGIMNNIYGQRFDSAMTRIGSNFDVSGDTDSLKTEEYPSVSWGMDNRFVVVWTRYFTENAHIFGRLFDSTGTALTDNFWVDVGHADYSDSTITCKNPDVSMSRDGQFIVAWNEYYDDPDDSTKPFARAFSGLGTAESSPVYLQDACCLGCQAQTEEPAVAIQPIDLSDSSIHSSWVCNIDFHGWADVVGAEAGIYAPQKAITDTVRLFFADPADRSFIYQFGKVTTDTGEAINLVYKSKAFNFNSIAHQKRVYRFFSDYYLPTGNFTVNFYTHFGDTLRYSNTVTDAGGYRYVRIPLDIDCRGRNFSYEITSSDLLELGKIRLRLKKEED